MTDDLQFVEATIYVDDVQMERMQGAYATALAQGAEFRLTIKRWHEQGGGGEQDDTDIAQGGDVQVQRVPPAIRGAGDDGGGDSEAHA